MRHPSSEAELRASFVAVFGALFPKSEWPAARLEPVLASLRYRELAAGTTILREGQVCGSVPFVLEGSIRVFKTAESGREITLYRVEPGQTCILSTGCRPGGALGKADGPIAGKADGLAAGKAAGLAAFPASVVAERDTAAAFMPTELARSLLSEGPSFRAFVLEQYSRRMAEVIELVEEVAFRRVDERLRAWLSERAAAGASLVTATHQELADHVGTSREVVSRILKDWEERGALELSRGELRLLPGFQALRL